MTIIIIIKLFIRQLLPMSKINETVGNITDDYFDAVLSDPKEPVILYMHGNSGNRASSHRVELYKVFQQLNYHLIAFDYRSKY